MFYSERYKVLIIGIPKTGSTAVEKAMLDYDNEGENHSIRVGDRLFTGDDFAQGIVGHARAAEIKDTLGEEYYNSLASIAFIRHPLAKLVSAYFFNRSGSLTGFLDKKGNKKILQRKVKSFLTILIAKIMPFKLWCFIYPYKSNLEYVLDENGIRIVKYIGRTECLEADLIRFLEKLKMNTDKLNLKMINKSNHKAYESYFKSKWFRNLIERKVKDDLIFYKKICDEINE